MAFVLICAVLGACSVADEGGASTVSTGTVQSKVSNENRLALNRLALNRLALNRLALSRLSLERIHGDSQAVDTTSELLATEEGREILRYVVQCAFEEGAILVGVHDGQTYEFPGLLGLATRWEHRPLRESEQRLMSACLLAHVNAYGLSVAISLRSHRALDVTEEERRDYPVYEGTFFGHVFDGEVTRVYACEGSPAPAALAHSMDREVRVCTDPTEDCAIIALGPCREVCDRRTENEGWRRCHAEGEVYDETISVYLYADDPSGENQRCTSCWGCDMEASEGAAAILDCNRSWDCSASCESGAKCTVDAAKSWDFEGEIAGARIGEVDCYKVKDCAVACLDGATCDVNSYKSKDTRVECRDDASCGVGCKKGKDCRVECRDDASCEVSCEKSKDCRVECRDDTQCRVQCAGHHWSCDAVECRDGASCEIDCRDTRRCDFAVCLDNASCLLDCHDAEECAFAYCAGGAVNCPGNIVVCGRPCP